MIKSVKGRKGRSLRKLGAGLVAMILVVIMVVGLLPTNVSAKSSDEATDSLYSLSLGDNASTEYAGRIWSDKSVYTENQYFQLYTEPGQRENIQRVDNDSDFLVSFSTLATSMAISGKTQVPLDVVFIIDMSGSMRDNNMDDGKSRMSHTIDALNTAIENLLNTNEHTRIGVVAFSGEATTLLKLDHYTKLNNNAFFSTNNWESEIYTRAVGAEYGRIDTRTTTTRGTNIQRGVFDGMNMLATEEDTTVEINGKNVQRVPSVVLLSDGAPTIGSTHATWWDLSSDNTDYSYDEERPLYGMQALMTASYMKAAIDRRYDVAGSVYETTVYSIGMGINNISDREDKNLAFVTIDPATYINRTNSNNIRAIREAWQTYQSNNFTGTPSLAGRNSQYTFRHPEAANEIDSIEYVDRYYDADSASEVTDVFNDIVSNITISAAQVPTEIKGTDPINDGFITYTDPIGKYMEVKNIKALLYGGTKFETLNQPLVEGNKTTYTFQGEVHSAVYGNQNVSAIKIEVTTENGEQTLVVKVPASVIPVRLNTITLDENENIVSHTNNGAFPMRVLYTVGLQEGIVENGVVQTSKLTQAYIDANTNHDGTINFYSNLFTGENKVQGVNEEGHMVTRTAGNATVEFEPAHTNPFYYMQEDDCIYSDAACTKLVSIDEALDDDATYYYKTSFYHNLREETRVVARTGEQLKRTSLVEINGHWHRAKGSPRLNRILEFEGIKEENNTNTAEDFYVPTFEYAEGSTSAYDGKYKIYLGNNGVLSVAASGTLAISKHVEIPAGLKPSTDEFEFTVDLNGIAQLAGEYDYEIVDVNETVLKTGTLKDRDTIILKDGEKAYIYNVPHDTTYSVTEKDYTGQGFTTAVLNNEGEIIAGDTIQASFVNTYEADAVTVPVNQGFQVSKQLTGRDWNDDAFTFILESVDEAAPMPDGSANGVKEITIREGSNTYVEDQIITAGFGEITYENPGIYVYTVAEKMPESAAGYLPGMSYSGAIYRIVVTVTDNGLGELVAETVMTQTNNDDGFPVTAGNVLAEGEEVAAFVNAYSANSTSWTPVGSKHYNDYSGKNPLAARMFQFKMEPIGTNAAEAPMPATGTYGDGAGRYYIANNIGTEVAYPTIVFDHEHASSTGITYEYRFTEMIPEGAVQNSDGTYTLNGVTYDGSAFTVTVVATTNSQDDDVQIQVTYAKDGDTTNTYHRAEFTNSYATDTTDAVIKGFKTLIGRNIKHNEFEFVLEAVNDEALEVLPAPVKKQLAINDAANETTNEKAFEFDALTFTKPGDYTFKVTETKGNAGGVTYDAAEWQVKVAVTDVDGQGNKTGKLVAAVYYNEVLADANSKGVQFTNTYQAVMDDKDSVELVGTKELVGREIKEGEFLFVVEPVDNAPIQARASAYAFAKTDGSIELLSNVIYNAPGIYQYLIYEYIPDAATQNPDGTYTFDGVTYDQKVYRYTVTIEDNLNGELQVASDKLEVKENNSDTSVWQDATVYEPTFTNSYEATPVERTVPTLYKVLTGGRGTGLAANEFEFEFSVAGTTLDGTSILAKNPEGNPVRPLSEFIELDGTFLRSDVENGILGVVGNAADNTAENGSYTGSIQFGKLTFREAGNYTITIRELVPNGTYTLNGVTYTAETLVAEFRVRDNTLGALEAELVSLHGNYTFTNVYESQPDDVQLTIYKKFTGRGTTPEEEKWLAGDQFSFEVIIRDQNTQAAVDAGDVVFPTVSGTNSIQTLTISAEDADKTVTTPAITFKKPGTYQFRVREVNGGIPGVNYDSNPKDVTVTVTDDNKGQLTATYTVAGVAGNAPTLEFHNVYVPGAVPLSGHDRLRVIKNFTGRENNQWLDSDYFLFTLEWNKKDAQAASDVDLPATNAATSAILTDENITLPAGTVGLAVTNANRAYAHFGDIVFHKEGEYEFTVKEWIPQNDTNNVVNGITYDTTEYKVVVTVANNNNVNAELEVESVVYKEAEEQTASLEFNNTYSVTEVRLPGSTNLVVTKQLTGRDWFEDDEFKFVLSADGEATSKAVADRFVILPANANGLVIDDTTENYTASFGDIIFKKAGTYYFAIKEAAGSISNVAYDKHTASVIVVVTDNHNGGLTAAVAAASAGAKVFENIYTPDAVTAVLAGDKVLNGRTLAEGEFRFRIRVADDSEENTPLPARITVRNGKAGDVSAVEFGAIAYTEAGTYKYIISEDRGDLPGVTYDNELVEVTVEVTYDAVTGRLAKAVSYKKGNEELGAAGFEFVNTYTTSATDDVSIRAEKEVTATPGNSYVMSGNEFEFEIDPADGNPSSDPIQRTLVKNAADGTVVFANAQYTEPGTYVYTIHEESGDKGGIHYDDTVYTVTVTVKDDETVAKLKATVSIVKDKGTAEEKVVQSIVFNNGYDPKEATAVLHGHKHLEGGHKELELNEFAFELRAVDYAPNGNVVTKAKDTPMPEEDIIVRNKATGLFQFGVITYEQPGTYAYEIREVNEGKKGYTYDDAVKTVIVTVTDNQNHELVATVDGVMDSQGNPLVVFTNEYVPSATKATIGGTKKLSGRDMTVDGSGKGEFEFALLDSTGQEIDTATNVSEGAESAFAFDEITYDKAGTYRYTVIEKNTRVSGVKYDLETAYTVEVTVTDRTSKGAVTGQLKATVKYCANNQEVKSEEVVFHNSYKGAPTTAILGAAKEIQGRTLKADEFTFKLEALTAGAPMPETGKEVAKNTEGGAVNFGEIVFEKAGTYEYQISEVKGDDAYVTYDAAVYKVTVKVTDDLKGQLSAEVSGVEEAVFKNVYKAEPVEVILGGKKVLSGRALKGNEFEFILKDSEGNIIEEVFNSENGTFTFKGIIFDKVGSYNFVIEEKNTKLSGITYDEGICYVHVDVVDDYKGNLIPTVTYGKDAKMSDSVVFTNTYKAAATSVQIGAMKTLKGRDLKAGEFRFVLEDEQGGKIYAVNAADGTILFDKITYTEAGTYVYKLYEEKGTAEYVTYDDKVYTVTIVVEDDMEGSLAVTSQFDSSKFVFKNTYKNPEVVYTGDNASIITMLTMFVLSAGAILMSFKKMYKK